MSSCRRIHVLTIPLNAEVLPVSRAHAQILLRRRSDGPVVVRDESKGPRTTPAICIQATFSSQQALDLVKSDLQRFLPHLLVRVRLERRRSCGWDEPTCSCELLEVLETGPCYHQQGACQRHSYLARRSTPDAPRLVEEQVAAILRGTRQAGWSVISAAGKSPARSSRNERAFPALPAAKHVISTPRRREARW